MQNVCIPLGFANIDASNSPKYRTFLQFMSTRHKLPKNIYRCVGDISEVTNMHIQKSKCISVTQFGSEQLGSECQTLLKTHTGHIMWPEYLRVLVLGDLVYVSDVDS